MSDWNEQIITEFRANGGVVGGMFEGKPLLLLHHVGAKTGTKRLSPLGYKALDGGYAVFASKGGAPKNPAWYHNLLAHPDATVEVGADTVEVQAREATGDERRAIWEAWKTEWPQFAEYETKTDRVIPVMVLERKA